MARPFPILQPAVRCVGAAASTRYINIHETRIDAGPFDTNLRNRLIIEIRTAIWFDSVLSPRTTCCLSTGDRRREPLQNARFHPSVCRRLATSAKSFSFRCRNLDLRLLTHVTRLRFMSLSSKLTTEVLCDLTEVLCVCVDHFRRILWVMHYTSEIIRT